MVATSDDPDEQALVEAARAESARFLDLYDRYFARVWAYVLKRTRNRTDAEDVTSEVFHRALLNLDRYEWRGVPFAAWLYRIAANELADRRAAAARLAPGAHPPERASADPELDEQVALFELVDRLPDDQRRVIEMRFGEGRSLREAAEALGRSEGAIKQLQRRALENLRAGMEKSHG